jgi:hypothetical protein
MTDNNLRSEKLIKVFYVIFVLTISKKISEDNYIYLLHKLTGVGFRITSVSCIENIIFYLDSRGFKYSYMITILLYLKDDIFISVSNICDNYIEMKCYVYEDKTVSNTDVIIRSKDLMRKKQNVLRSFAKLYPPSKTELVNSHFSDDLINRLFQLRNIFDLDILKFMDIKLVPYKQVKEMNLVDLTGYYLSCINGIKNKLTEWINMCDTYIDSEVKYMTSIQQIVNTDNFTIVFDEDTFDLSTSLKKC